MILTGNLLLRCNSFNFARPRRPRFRRKESAMNRRHGAIHSRTKRGMIKRATDKTRFSNLYNASVDQDAGIQQQLTREEMGLKSAAAGQRCAR